MRKIKIAQIGVDHDHAAMAFTSLSTQTEIFDFAGYCDPEEEVYYGKDGARLVAGFPTPEGETVWCPEKYQGVPKMSLEALFAIPGLEAVVIETSERNLTDYAKMAADRGLHVYMDKPGGYVYSEYEALINTFKKTGKVFQAGYMYRYNPEVKKLFKEIEEGKYGEIYAVECHMDCMHTVYKRDWLKKYRGGMMYFLGCHLIDLIYRIQGEPLEVLPMNTCTGFGGAEGEDYGFAVLKYPKGISFAKTCAAEPGGYMRRQLVVCGEKGTAVLEPLEEAVKTGPESTQVTRTRKVTEDIYNWNTDGDRAVSDCYHRYDAMLADFAAFVRGEKENPYTLDYELQMYRVLLKACGIEEK